MFLVQNWQFPNPSHNCKIKAIVDAQEFKWAKVLFRVIKLFYGHFYWQAFVFNKQALISW